MYEKSQVEFLKLQQKAEKVNGQDLIIKKNPTEPRGGYLDHNELEIMKNHWIARENKPADEAPKSPMEALQAMRDNMGFPNKNLCTEEIHTRFETLNVEGNEVGLWRYYLRKGQYEKKRPCFIFLHGGGWVGGTPYTVENPCRLIAELSGAVVFNVDYALAPEKKFPNGFNDCFGVVKHIYDNADFYGIDKEKISVGGDSAGGNLTAAIATKDRDLGTNMVKLQVLMYACVVFSPKAVNWNISDYKISEEQFPMINGCLGIGRPSDDGNDEPMMANMYFADWKTEAELPYASPLLTDSYKGLPKTLSVACEFDGLRVQDEEYSKRLAEAGVDVKAIRYRGVSHAFIDRLGFVPQAEDLCIEIANAIKNL